MSAFADPKRPIQVEKSSSLGFCFWLASPASLPMSITVAATAITATVAGKQQQPEVLFTLIRHRGFVAFVKQHH